LSCHRSGFFHKRSPRRGCCVASLYPSWRSLDSILLVCSKYKQTTPFFLRNVGDVVALPRVAFCAVPTRHAAERILSSVIPVVTADTVPSVNGAS